MFLLTVAVCGSGIQDKSVVSDDQLSSPSYYANSVIYHPKNARLLDTSNPGWCPYGTRDPGEFLRLSMLILTSVYFWKTRFKDFLMLKQLEKKLKWEIARDH